MLFVTGVVEQTLDNGGGTFTPEGEGIERDWGYFVGGIVSPWVVQAAWFENHGETFVENFVANHRHYFNEDDVYLGTWVDSGSVYLDVSEWVATPGMARQLAEARGELAYWNCARHEAIPL